MITKINDNISIWQEFNLIELSLDETVFNSSDSKRELAKWGFNKQRIAIRNRWFDVINPSELVRSRNKSDGYYRVIYIQINMESSEYYIGKANIKTWSQLQRYPGSGVKFKSKYKKHKKEFVRYYIAICDTQKETEKLEASIVNEDILSDEYCLNLVKGGGGTTKRPPSAETREKKREYMKNNPEFFKPMLEASKKAFQSGDTAALRARSKRIKEVFSQDKYREMSRKRLNKLKEENPEAYAEMRRKSKESIRNQEIQAKRQASLKIYAKKHPKEYKAWQEKLIKSRTSPEANEKRSASIKKFNETNPKKAKENTQKRASAAANKTSKAVCMIDLESENVLQTFPSQHEAARWLVEKGIAKNENCVSSINGVCLRRPCTTGYGYRKKAYGYDWRFAEEISI